MHGSLLHGFKQFVLGRDGQEGWDAIVGTANAHGWYFATRIYEDEELGRLVRMTAAYEDRPRTAVLEEYGAALVPTLMTMYRSFVDPSWKTIGLLLNAENVIHRTIRITDRSANPPQLLVRKLSEREVEIEYSSRRRLCAVAVGISRGVAAYFGEEVTVEQPHCMERGAPACRILVRMASSSH